MDDDSRAGSWETRTEVPLFFVSLLFLASYAVRVLTPHLSAPWRDIWLLLTLAAWLCFAVDYGVRLALSGQGLRFVHRHPLDTVVLLLPLLRPLRMVRLYNA